MHDKRRHERTTEFAGYCKYQSKIFQILSPERRNIEPKNLEDMTFDYRNYSIFKILRLLQGSDICLIFLLFVYYLYT